MSVMYRGVRMEANFDKRFLSRHGGLFLDPGFSTRRLNPFDDFSDCEIVSDKFWGLCQFDWRHEEVCITGAGCLLKGAAEFYLIGGRRCALWRSLNGFVRSLEELINESPSSQRSSA